MPGYATYPDLAGKVAVVTGGSRGIGAATAAALAANGVAVAVVGRDPGATAASSAAARALGAAAIGVTADCTREDQVAGLRERVTAELGSPAILAAFAGGNGMPVPTEAETPAHWREVIESDLTSAFLTVSAFLPEMLARGGGSVITMASDAARHAGKSCAAYAAAKAGVIAFTRHLAGEYAGRGVRANCLAPAAVENEKMRTWMTAEQRAALGGTFPLGRIGQPDDVASATLYLASSASSWVTGITLDITGGKVML